MSERVWRPGKQPPWQRKQWRISLGDVTTCRASGGRTANPFRFAAFGSTVCAMERPLPRPFLGHGVGLRLPHYERALAHGLDVDWVEVISENFMRPGGRPRAVLERLRRDMPIVMHGVSMGIGSVEPLDQAYLRRLRQVADELEPAWISDHVCWNRIGPHHAHDLLPLPYTEEALRLLCDRVSAAQDALGRRLVLENVSSYVGYRASEMTEWTFLAELATRADCLLLVDLNNIIVSAVNHEFAASDFLAGLPAERVWQFHLANHDRRPNHRFDSHRGAVPDDVWALYDEARARFGDVSTLIEWDEDVPTWEVLRAEQQKAKARAQRPRATVPASRRPASPIAEIHAGNKQLTRGEPLAATQKLFWEVIRYPTGAAALVANHAETSARVTGVFEETPAFSRLERLELYADAYFWRLYDVLLGMFSLTAALLGKASFQNLATDYVLAHPSVHPDVGGIGERLPTFLQAHTLSQHVPAAHEVARVEWQIAQALHGPNDDAATTNMLAALPSDAWPTLRLRLVATAAVVPCTIDTAQLSMQHALRDTAPQTDPLGELPAAAAGHVVVWRKGFAAMQRCPSEREARALRQLQTTCTFDEVCAHASSPAMAAGWLAQWIDEELIALA